MDLCRDLIRIDTTNFGDDSGPGSARRASDWQMDPFSGEIEDGYLWGRGAVNMADFDAMLLTTVRQRRREGRVPKRPITLCFTADEEAGGHRGAEVLINQHPEEFEGRHGRRG